MKDICPHPVMQLQCLDEIFERFIIEFSPRSICVLGFTAGNGFQHLVNRDFERIVGIDINPEYVVNVETGLYRMFRTFS